MEKKLDKFIFTFVGAGALGFLGMDRFMRGQTGLALIKVFTFGGLGIWYLIDLIVALSNLGNGKNHFTFNDGKWNEDSEKTIDKYIYALTTVLNLDRIIRGQVGLGILKFITLGGFGIWMVVDLVIVFSRLANDVSQFKFVKGNWA